MVVFFGGEDAGKASVRVQTVRCYDLPFAFLMTPLDGGFDFVERFSFEKGKDLFRLIFEFSSSPLISGVDPVDMFWAQEPIWLRVFGCRFSPVDV